MLVDGVVVFASCMVFARNSTKCGKKGKYGGQAALHSLMVGRCARAQGLGGPYHGGPGGEVNTEHESIYYIYILYLKLLAWIQSQQDSGRKIRCNGSEKSFWR